MKILFDNGTPKPMARSLTGHTVTYARQIGWQASARARLMRLRKAEGREKELLGADERR